MCHFRHPLALKHPVKPPLLECWTELPFFFTCLGCISFNLREIAGFFALAWVFQIAFSQRLTALISVCVAGLSFNPGFDLGTCRLQVQQHTLLFMGMMAFSII